MIWRTGVSLEEWPIKDHFAGVIPFRQDANQLLFGENQQGANTVLGHLFNRLIDRLIGRHRQNSILVFAVKHQSNRV
jgi:hypothetical protein